jgi:hypothetical protein
VLGFGALAATWPVAAVLPGTQVLGGARDATPRAPYAAVVAMAEGAAAGRRALPPALVRPPPADGAPADQRALREDRGGRRVPHRTSCRPGCNGPEAGRTTTPAPRRPAAVVAAAGARRCPPPRRQAPHVHRAPRHRAESPRAPPARASGDGQDKGKEHLARRQGRQGDAKAKDAPRSRHRGARATTRAARPTGEGSPSTRATRSTEADKGAPRRDATGELSRADQSTYRRAASGRDDKGGADGDKPKREEPRRRRRRQAMATSGRRTPRRRATRQGRARPGQRRRRAKATSARPCSARPASLLEPRGPLALLRLPESRPRAASRSPSARQKNGPDARGDGTAAR